MSREPERSSAPRTVSARERPARSSSALFHGAQLLGEAGLFGLPATSLPSAAASAPGVLAQRLDLGRDAVLGLEVAVVDVEVLGRQAPDRLHVLADLAGERDGAHVTLGEAVDLVVEGAEGLEREQRDDEQERDACSPKAAPRRTARGRLAKRDMVRFIGPTHSGLDAFDRSIVHFRRRARQSRTAQSASPEAR